MTVGLALQGILNISNATWHPRVFIEAGSHKLDEAVVLSGDEWPHLENISIVGLPGKQRKLQSMAMVSLNQLLLFTAPTTLKVD